MQVLCQICLNCRNLKCKGLEQNRLLIFGFSFIPGNSDNILKQILCFANDIELSSLDYNTEVHKKPFKMIRFGGKISFLNKQKWMLRFQFLLLMKEIEHSLPLNIAIVNSSGWFLTIDLIWNLLCFTVLS